AQSLFSAGKAVSADAASLPTTEIAAGDAVDTFTLAVASVAAELAKSRGEARRPAQQGGLAGHATRISGLDAPPGAVLAGRGGVLLRAGKKRFKRVAIS